MTRLITEWGARAYPIGRGRSKIHANRYRDRIDCSRHLDGSFNGADSRADPYTFTAVDVPGATVTVVNGLNDRGDVVGWYRTGISGEPNSVDHGFLLRYGKFTTIDVPGSQGVTVARGINNRGDIVGYYLTDNPTVPLLGFLLSRHGKFTIIDCGPFTEPHGINDRRDIVGRGGFDNEGFLLRNGKCIPIGVPGAITTTVEGINNAGDIVGWYDDPVRQAWLCIIPRQIHDNRPAAINSHRGYWYQ